MNLYTSYYISPIGKMKLQCSDRHVKSVLFDDSDEDAKVQEHKLLSTCSKQLDEYFTGKRKQFTLPVNQDGSEFQMKIWNLLYSIPYGKTISYMTLSKQYGNMKAIRAIASANGKNSLVIIVPCHRVIGSNSDLVGYGGGLWRKKWLLAHEAKHEFGVQEISF